MNSFLQKLNYVVAGLIVLLILACIPSFLNFNNKKESIQNELNQLSSYKFKIDGDVNIALLPMPRISMDNITAIDENGDSLQVSKIMIYPSFSTIFSDKIKINKIAIQDAELNLNKIKVDEGKTGKIISAMPNFELINATVVFDSGIGIDTKIKNLNAKFNFSGGESRDLTLVSNFGLKNIKYGLNATFKNINEGGNSDSASVILDNESIKLSFAGRLKNVFKNPELDGKLTITLVQSSRNKDSITNALIKDNFNATAEVYVTDSLVSVSNLILSSSSISNAKGEFEWSFGAEQELDFSLNVDKIDMDKMFSKKDEEKIEEVSFLTVLEKIIRPVINEFGFNANTQIFGGADFKIGEVRLNQQDVKNINLNFDIYNGDIALNKLAFEAPGKTVYSLKGNMTFNEVRPRFEGDSVLKIEDVVEFAKWLEIPVSEKLQKDKPNLNLTTKVDLIPRSLRLTGIKFNMGDTNIIGRLAFKETGERRLNTKFTLRVNEINTNDFNLGGALDGFIEALYLSDGDKFGSKYLEYVNDYRWLRTFPLNLNLELLVDKAVFKDKAFKEVYTNFRVSPNSLVMDNVSINSDILKMSGSVGVSITAIKPVLNVDLKIQDADYTSLASLVPSNDDLRKKWLEEQSKIKSSTKAPDNNENKGAVNQSAVAFNFYGIQNFNGNLKIVADQLRNTTFPISGFNIDCTIDEGVLKFNMLGLNVFNGVYESKGSLSIVNNIANLSFAYAINNFNPESFLTYLFGYQNFQGYMSANGTFATSGTNSEDVMKNLEGNINFVGKKITFRGMDLSEIIKTTESGESTGVRLNKLKVATTTGQTVFDDVSGNIIIKDVVDEATGSKSKLATMTNIELSTNRSKGYYNASVDYINGLINGLGTISFIPIGSYATMSIDTTNQGRMATQDYAVNSDKIAGFLQKQIAQENADTAAKNEQDKVQSLLRNRKL